MKADDRKQSHKKSKEKSNCRSLNRSSYALIKEKDV